MTATSFGVLRHHTALHILSTASLYSGLLHRLHCYEDDRESLGWWCTPETHYWGSRGGKILTSRLAWTS